MARDDPHSYPGIGDAVTAIMFLGTPHQGSAHATYATVLAKIANTLTIGFQASRFTGIMRTGLVKSLKRDEAELLRIAQDFSRHTADIQMRSFIEGKCMKGMNRRIVDEASAYAGGATEKIIPMPGYDHKEICRPGSSLEAGLKLILGMINESLCLPGRFPASIAAGTVETAFSNLPLENKAFVGQQLILAELKSAFNESSGNGHVALYGLGGIGKSQVALRYAYQMKHTKPNIPIFWVFAGNKDKFDEAYLEIAKGLKLPGANDPKVDLIKLVKTSLENGPLEEWLMIVDNADDLAFSSGASEDEVHLQDWNAESLFDFIPSHPKGSVLYTTRNKADALQLISQGRVIQVQEMNIVDSKSLLRNKLGHEFANEEDWIDLVETLERLPLALVQATSYIRQSSWQVADYLKHFRSNIHDVPLSLLLHEFRDSTRDRTVSNALFRTWVITVQKLEERYPKAAETLWLMAFYNRQNIPRCLLSIFTIPTEGSSSGPDDSKGKAPRKRVRVTKDSYLAIDEGFMSINVEGDSGIAFDRAIGQLEGYSFVTRSGIGEETTYSLHRLVQTFAQHWLRSYLRTADKWVSKAISVLSQEFPSLDSGDRKKAAQLIPHVQEVFDYYSNPSLPAKKFGELLIVAADYLRTKAEYPLAAKYATKAIDVLTTYYGAEDPLTIIASYTLARVSEDNESPLEAEDLFRSIISNCERVTEKTHCSEVSVTKFQAMSGLSNVLRVKMELEAAQALAQRSVEGLKELKGWSSSYTLDSMTVLSTILGDSGHDTEAFEAQEELLMTMRKQYGPDDLRTLHTQHILAVTMYKLGKLRDAEEIARHVFREYKKEYGPYHQRTYSIAFNLGIVLENQGNFKEAHDVFLYALRYQRDRMSKELENTADCIHHAAFCLEKQHRYLEAQAYYQEVFDVFLATYGPESQATKASSSDIDRVRGLQGPTSTGSAPQSGEPSGSAHRSGVLSYYGPKTTRQTSNEPEKATYYDRDTKTRPKPWYGLAQPPDTGYGR